MFTMEFLPTSWAWVPDVQLQPSRRAEPAAAAAAAVKAPRAVSHDNLGWIHSISQFAKSGYPQAILVSVSVLYTVGTVSRRYYYRRQYVSRPPLKASKLSVPFELASQLARAASVAFVTLASVHSHGQWGQWINVALVGFTFVLGLFRLANDLRWRRMVLHQVNFLLVGALIVLALAELLPLLDRASEYKPDHFLLAALASLAAAVLVALITPREWLAPDLPPELSQKIPPPQPTVEETSSWFSYFATFGYLTPVIWRGSRKNVEMDDLPGLPWFDDPLIMLSRVTKAREKGRSTLRTIFYFAPQQILAMIFYVMMGYSLDLLPAFAMYRLLTYLDDPDNAPISPALWLCILFFGPISRTIAFQQYYFIASRLKAHFKSAFNLELYYRAMTSMELDEDIINDITKGQKGSAQKSTTTGRLANLMASDIDAIDLAKDSLLMAFVGVPIATVLSFIGLYRILGWVSFVGVAIIFISSPVPAWLAQMMGSSQRLLKQAQDARISLVSEYLSSIRAIKYFAWEDPMTSHINEARNAEQKQIWRVNILWVISHQFMGMLPIIALLTIFSLYVGVTKQPLTAATAFTTITLVTILRNNISQVSYITRTSTSAWISLKRLDRYFESTVPLTKYPVGPLHVNAATFRRTRKAEFRLHNISIDFVQGGLNVVMGQSGSGKTTLLLSLLGETVLEKGSVRRPEDVAFASQTAWLENASIKDNILFSASFEEARYDRILEACCLLVDLDELPERDSTEVGENGTMLSGGQKARVALARALYSKASLILLDDVFSALDTKTAALLWERCFCSDLLHGRTVILVTNMSWIRSQADLAVTIENGHIKSTEQNLGVTRTPVVLSTENHGEEELIDSQTNTNPLLTDSKPAASKAPKDDIKNEMEASSSSGRLMFMKYASFFVSPRYLLFAFFISFFSVATYIGATLWISTWVDAYSKEAAVDIAFYLGIYAAICIAELLSTAGVILSYANGAWVAAQRLHQEFINAMMSAPLSFFKHIPVGRIVNRFSRDMTTLDNTISRVLIVFSEQFWRLIVQTGAVSSIMPVFMVPALITCMFGILAGEMYTRTAVVVRKLVASSQSPVFSQFSDSLAGLAVIRAREAMPDVFADRLAKSLRVYSRTIETNFNLNRWIAVRIDFIMAFVMLCAGLIAVSKAGTLPAGLVGFSLSNATGLGSVILWLVRASNELEVELQSFGRILEYATIEPEEKLAEEASLSYQEEEIPHDWPRTGAVEFRNVTIKYDLDGPEILKNVSLKFKAGERVAVIGRTGSGKSTLVLSLLHLTHIVSGTILYDGVDITRVPRRRLRQALTIIPQEATLFNGTVESNLDPAGEVPKPTLEKALASCAGIASFQFRNGSSAEPAEPPATAEPTADEPTETQPLLGGDASGFPSTAAAYGSTGLSLATTVSARGENFSHGQRQVLSLCRALVRRSRLMLLDEATASMDPETDRGMQTVLRRELSANSNAESFLSSSPGGDHSSGDDGGSSRTLVTVAHRLRTIADYDKVVVMGSGRVVEVGSPKDLLEARGTFYDMVHHSGEEKELVHMIEEAAATRAA